MQVVRKRRIGAVLAVACVVLMMAAAVIGWGLAMLGAVICGGAAYPMLTLNGKDVAP